MSIWIRSQDKENLIKCDHFEIETFELKHLCASDVKTYKLMYPTHARINKFKEENDIELIEIDLRKENAQTYAIIRYKDIQRHYEYRVRTPQCVLGTYSTKEKALKVLDMIQECIESNNSHHNSQWDSTPHLVYTVFQMPDDEDI